MKRASVLLMTAVLAAAATQVQGQGREQRRTENTQVVEACKAEIQQLCQGQKGQQAEQCLKNNESKLSTQCKGAISKTPQQPQ